MVKDVFETFVKEANQMAIIFEEVSRTWCAGRGEANGELWSGQNFQSLQKFCMCLGSTWFAEKLLEAGAEVQLWQDPVGDVKP